MLTDLIAPIESFRATDDNWRDLDAHVQSLVASGEDLFAALPALLRVFERYPRHDGHGVFWSILHAIESVRGFEPILLDHVTRTPTELGITMLERLATSGFPRIGAVELEPLIAELKPRAPVLDYSLEPITSRPPRPLSAPLLAELARFDPRPGNVDWSPLLVLVAQLLDTRDTDAIVTPLLQTLDRFHTYDGFSPFWPIVNGLEQLPRFASALVASTQTTPTRYGTTLLLRQLAREVYVVDGVDIAALAAHQLAGS
jgi:hypothetical protein